MTESISSPGGGGASAPAAPDTSPWRIDVNVFAPPKATVGPWGLLAGSFLYGTARYNSSPALNDRIDWEVSPAKGTWELWVYHNLDGNRGIQTWSLDDGAGAFTELDVIDGYGGPSANVPVVVSGIVLAADVPVRTLRCQITGANPSSSNFYAAISAVHLRRTA